jgi:hypothetical protein
MNIRIFLLLFLFIACEELNIDPENPFEASPDEQIPVVEELYYESDSSSATFNWSGNKFALEFSYMFESHSYAEQILQPYNNWSDWSIDTTITLDNLDEGNYTFHVKSRFDVIEQEVNATLDFEIDAITEAALRIYPLRQEVNVGNSLIIFLYAENIEDIAGSQIQFQFDKNQVEYIENANNCGIETDLFCPVLGDEDNSITIMNWNINGDYNRDNPLVQLSFNRIGNEDTEIIISSATVRNSENEDISIENYYNGSIEIVD